LVALLLSEDLFICAKYLLSDANRTSDRLTHRRRAPLQAWFGHRNIQHTVRYTELAPDRFKLFWKWAHSASLRTAHRRPRSTCCEAFRLTCASADISSHRRTADRPPGVWSAIGVPSRPPGGGL